MVTTTEHLGLSVPGATTSSKRLQDIVAVKDTIIQLDTILDDLRYW
jgi:hypothetical protein